MDYANAIVSVIDDDPLARDIIAGEIEEAGMRPRIFDGPYGGNIDRLLEEVVADSQFAVCDHRLATHGFASFTGAEVAARLISERKHPTLVVTTYRSIDRDNFRKFRTQVPFIIDRDDMDGSNFVDFFSLCRKEINSDPPDNRKGTRAIIRVQNVSTDKGPNGYVEAIVGQWRENHAIRLPFDVMGNEIVSKVSPGARLIARINLGADDEELLYFDSFELAPVPDEDDGLG